MQDVLGFEPRPSHSKPSVCGAGESPGTGDTRFLRLVGQAIARPIMRNFAYDVTAKTTIRALRA
jgi:hypothetical protein